MSKSIFRTMKLEYLKHNFKTVAIVNKEEYTIVPSKSCSVGDTVWVLNGEELVETKIF